MPRGEDSKAGAGSPGAGGLRPAERAHRAGLVLQDALGTFLRDGGLRHASSLAFYAILASMPALVLLTFLVGGITGRYAAAHHRLTEHLARMVPGQGERVLAEVADLTRHAGHAGLLNLAVFGLSLVPLVSALREIIQGIYKEPETRSLWLAKAADLGAGLATLAALAFLAGAEVIAQVSGAKGPLAFSISFLAATLLVAGLFRLYAPRSARAWHLLAGSLATTSAWLLLRPAFSAFLVLDPSYGLAFGSFKSLFIIVVWIYVSMASLLLGAEVAAACHRGEAVAIKRLLEGRLMPRRAGSRLVVEAQSGKVFFREGDAGEEMFYVLAGTVSVRKGGREIARIGPGGFLGEMTFLLGMARSAEAVALEPCRCVVVNERNFRQLLREFPDTVRAMLVEMASRLRATSGRVAGLAPDSGAGDPEEAVQEGVPEEPEGVEPPQLLHR